jgi:cytidylate kinase
MSAVPVIAIDGPSASGKGTVAQRVAQALGYHYLDSGAIYRAAALDALQAGIHLADEAALAARAATLDLRFTDGKVWIGAQDATDAIRTEKVGEAASTVAALPALRAALLQRQRDFRRLPGLVGDGRDLGSVVFQDAQLKVFLTASVEARAWRRTRQLVPEKAGETTIETAGELASDLKLAPTSVETGSLSRAVAQTPHPTENSPKQLIDKGISPKINPLFEATLAQVTADLKKRDERDAQRSVAPTVKLPEALLLDTTHLTADEAVSQVLAWAAGRAM